MDRLTLGDKLVVTNRDKSAHYEFSVESLPEQVVVRFAHILDSIRRKEAEKLLEF